MKAGAQAGSAPNTIPRWALDLLERLYDEDGVILCQRGHYRVGVVMKGGQFVAKGTGSTLSQAFDQANKPVQRRWAFWCRARDGHNVKRRCRVCRYRGVKGFEESAEPMADGTLQGPALGLEVRP